MKRKALAILLSATMAVTVLTGCGSSSDDKSGELKLKADESELEDGKYYIRHQNGKFDEIPDITDAQGASDILWYTKSGFNKIPHLVKGAGDTLVYYSTKDVGGDGGYEFSRYYDLGYTVGLSGLTPDETTGRYSIKTDSDAHCTYPESEADELLTAETDDVIIDSIGGKNIRRDNAADQLQQSQTVSTDTGDGSTESTDQSAQQSTVTDDDGVSSAMVTKYGTLKNLKAGATYTLYTYSGTIRKTINLKANIRVLGLADKYTSNSYVYDRKDSKLINIGVPDWFNTGYYTIGTSVFCYVNGQTYDSTTQYNNPNKAPADGVQSKTSVSDQETEDAQTDPYSYDDYMDITFDNTGTAQVTFSIDDITEDEAQYMGSFKAAFFTSANQKTDFVQSGMGVYTCTVQVASGTAYRIGYSGLPDSLKTRALVNYQIE